MEQYNSIQQILKKENGHDRKPIYPSTVIQAVFDAKTGASLEAILAQFNSIYVQYQGTPQATRNIIPVEMRRAGLMITYMNMDSETITERASSAVQKDNDHWGLDVNWSRVDELSLSGDIAVSANGTWIINGVDTKVPARGSKGDAGLTPWLKTIDNKLHYSYDNTTWEPCSDYLAGYFRFNATSSDSQAGTIGKIQISKDNKTWQDLSPEFRNYLRIQGYVATTSALPKNQVVGTIYGVNEGTNTYSLHVWDGSTWVNNGTFTSIAAGVVQETGDSETEVMSQKAVTDKLSELGLKLLKLDGWGRNTEDAGVSEVGQIYYNYVTKEIRRIITAGLAYEIILFRDDAIYIYDNKLYIYDGDILVENNIEQINKLSLITSSNTIKGVNYIYPKFKMGMYNLSGNFNEDGTPKLDSNYTRFTSDLIYYTGGKIKVKCADGYNFAIHMFSAFSFVEDTGWLLSDSEVKLNGAFFSICIKKGDSRVSFQDLLNANIEVEVVEDVVPTLATSEQLLSLHKDTASRIGNNGIVLHPSMFFNGTYNTSGILDMSQKIDGISICTIGYIDVLPHTCYKIIFGDTLYKVAYWGYNEEGEIINDDWAWYSDRTEINVKYATKLKIGLRLESGLYVSDYKDFPIIIQDNQSFQAYTSPSLSVVTSFNSFKFEKDNIYPNIDEDGFITATTSGPRYSTGVCFCGMGKVSVSINEGYRYAIVRYTGKQAFDSGWQTETKEWELSSFKAFNIVISRKDDEKFLAEDAGLVVNVIEPLYPSLASQAQVHSLNKRVNSLESSQNNSDVYPVNAPFNYGHLFIDKIYLDKPCVIPCQSKYDVFVSHQCGLRMIEFNVLLTKDGVPVCGHQNGTNILTTLADLDGNPVSVNVAETLYEDLRDKYRYNAILPQFRTPITTLKEALLECSKYNITPFVTYWNDETESLIKSIVGDRYVSYNGIRSKVKTTIFEYKQGTVDELVYRCQVVGPPYMLGVSLFSLRVMSDEEVSELVSKVHDLGCWIGWAGCYHTPEENEKYRSMGFDFNTSGWDIEDFDNADVVNESYDQIKGWDGIFVDGNIEIKDGYAVLKQGSGIKLGLDSPQGIVTKGSLRMRYNGTLNLSMGEHIAATFTKNNETFEQTTIFEIEAPNCYLYASDGDVEIYSVGFKAASIIA